MKIAFCDKCNGRNVFDDDELEKLKWAEHNCTICGRLSGQTVYEAIIDTMSFKLLFIDDELGFLQTMDAIMSKDYSVSTAANGAEGMKLAKSTQPDLIFLDISLPDIDGYELCRSLKLDDDTCHIPIFFITAHDRDIEEQKGFEVGAIDYITKPVSIQVLNAKIALHLRMKQLSC
jgi:cyclic di-GMP phosphodiesterase